MHLRDEKTGELLFCHLKRMDEGEKLKAVITGYSPKNQKL